MALVVEHLQKTFGRFPALNDVSFRAEDRQFIALLGPSGSGKTTLLRVLAGLETPDAGRVEVDGRDHLALTARQRRVGMVFQHYALFRHMTVAENIAFGLTVRPRRDRPAKAEVDRRVHDLLELVRLTGLEKRRPAQLSGGQRQRVALARALAVEPKLLLLDEPFGALDAKVRGELRTQLRRVHDATGVTTVFVTHDQEEAMDLADTVVVMSHGKVEQIGAPEALERDPASAFVFEFLGHVNRLPCRVEGGRAMLEGVAVEALSNSRQSGDGTALFRPHDVAVSVEAGAEGAPVRILSNHRRGLVQTLEAETQSGERLALEAPADAGAFAPGSEARVKPTRVFVA